MKRVLITGAAGNIGQKLRRHLLATDAYQLVLLDQVASAGSEIIVADLSAPERSWQTCFEGIDCVVHLAACAQDAGWPSLLAHNVIATMNVLDAAVQFAVGRVVVASSLHAMFGHLASASRIDESMPSAPISPYGVSKAVGEALVAQYTQRHGLSAVCLRLGWVPVAPRCPRPGTDELALQHRWLSDRDVCRACECAILAQTDGFTVAQVTSEVDGSPWAMSTARERLGYAPQDSLTPVAPILWRRLRARARRANDSLRRRIPYLCATNRVG